MNDLESCNPRRFRLMKALQLAKNAEVLAELDRLSRASSKRHKYDD
jgi:hypothetical protein